MGTYFFYVNKSKSQYFSIDPTDQDIKQYAVGNNFGSRAFSLLILKNQTDQTGFDDHEMIGSWIGDEILITGDDYDDWFRENRGTLTDISTAVLEMMCDVAPGDFLSYGGESWLIFYAAEMDIMPDRVRKKLLKHYRWKNNLSRSESERCDEVIAALRPRRPDVEDAG